MAEIIQYHLSKAFPFNLNRLWAHARGSALEGEIQIIWRGSWSLWGKSALCTLLHLQTIWCKSIFKREVLSAFSFGVCWLKLELLSTFECEVVFGRDQTLIGLIACSYIELVLEIAYWEPFRADCALGCIRDCIGGICNLGRVF
jgi:hypothetical protein